MKQKTATNFDPRKFEALLRADFRPFLEKVFSTLSPGQSFIPTWHLEAIAYQLERVRRGAIKRLIINMPPRSLKSVTASVAFPAFILGHDPTRRIICVSYSGDLAKKLANDFRAVAEARWYRELFPDTRIGQKDSETEIELTARGFRLATSVGGTLTGRGGDLIVIDDPLKPDDAHSETKRNTANEWFKNTLLSRLDDKRTGAIIIVMQRVHMDDLTGFVTSQSDEWEVLTLPAIAEIDEVIPISGTKVHRRRVGEALSPEREPLSVLENLKAQLGSDAFSAQYQQMPVPPGGAMIKRDWIKRYAELPLQRERSLILQSWDTASKGGPENDFSVCTTWCISRERRWYLMDVWRKRVRLSRAQGRRPQSCLPTRRTTRARRGRRRRHCARPRVARGGRWHSRGQAGSRQDHPDVRRLLKVRVWSGFSSRARLMACGFRGGALRVPREPARRSVQFRKPGADRRQLWVADGDIARGARRFQDLEAIDATLPRPLRVTRLSSVVRSSFRANLKDNRRQTDLCGL